MKSREWISLHCFVWDYSLFDELIVNLFESLYLQGFNESFFLRYWKGGPHVRVRVLIENESERERVYQICNDSVSNLVKGHSEITDKHLTKRDFYENTFTDGEEYDIEELPWFGNLHVEEIPYQPEIDRYGGLGEIRQSESVFTLSSRLAVDILKTFPDMKKKLFIFYALIEEVNSRILVSPYENINSLAKMASDFWISMQIQPLIAPSDSEKIYQIVEKSTLANIFDDFIDNLNKSYVSISKEQSEKYGQSVLFSQLHMFANRIGLPISGELSCYNFFKK